MKVVSDYTLVAKGESIAPGRIVEVEDREAKSLIERGLVRKPTAEDAVRSRLMQERAKAEAEPTASDDGDDEAPGEMTREELDARAKELGLDVTKIKGTGKDGNVVKADLVKAIEAAEKRSAPGNPSLA